MNIWLKKLHCRDSYEQHRVATSLELLFDLVFVIAIALADGGLHHALANHHLADGLLYFFVAFFSVWLGWINYTWFASACDNDDPLYRITTLLQMFGVGVMVVGIPMLFESSHDLGLIVFGYAIMRLAMVAQWLRAAYDNPSHRTICLKFAIGIALVQALWIARYFLLPSDNGFFMPSMFLLMLAELSIPILAGRTPWHPHHIAERYSL